MEVIISAKLPDNILSHTVPPFAARICRVVAGMEAPGGGSGNVWKGGGGSIEQQALRLRYIRWR